MKLSMLARAATILAAPLLAALPASAAEDGKELYLFNWTDYISPDLLKRFEAETGIHVVVDTFGNSGALVAKLTAGGGGGYDVVVPSQTTLKTLIDAGVLQKFDAHAMANFKTVVPPFDKVEGDPNRDYSVPYTWGMTGLAYDTAKAPAGAAPVDSWGDLFKPSPAFAGHIGMLKGDDSFRAAALYLGVDMCTDKPADAQKILDVLEAQKPSVKVYADSGLIDRLVDGEVGMASLINGEFHRAHVKLPSLRFVIPREGVGIWYDVLAIPKNAKHVENAKLFLNWMMEPKNAAEAANFTGDGVSIAGATEFLKADLRDDPAVNVPADMASRLKPISPCSAAANDLRNKVMTRLAR